MENALYFASGLLTGVIGLWAVSVVMAGGKRTPVPEVPWWASYNCCYRPVGNVHADYCPTRAGEWATPENVARAESEALAPKQEKAS